MAGRTSTIGGTALYDILPHIGEIFENAVVVKTKSDRANDANIRGIVELVGGAVLGEDSLAVVKLTVTRAEAQPTPSSKTSIRSGFTTPDRYTKV